MPPPSPFSVSGLSVFLTCGRERFFMGSTVIFGKPQQPKRRQWTERMYRGAKWKTPPQGRSVCPISSGFFTGLCLSSLFTAHQSLVGGEALMGADKDGTFLMCESILGAGSHLTAVSSFHACPSISV